jgi:hypothetical protein
MSRNPSIAAVFTIFSLACSPTPVSPDGAAFRGSELPLEAPEPTCPECHPACQVVFQASPSSKFDLGIEDAHAYSGYEISGVFVSLRRGAYSWSVSLDEYLDPKTMSGKIVLEDLSQPAGFERTPTSTLTGYLVLEYSAGEIEIPCTISFP